MGSYRDLVRGRVECCSVHFIYLLNLFNVFVRMMMGYSWWVLFWGRDGCYLYSTSFYRYFDSIWYLHLLLIILSSILYFYLLLVLSYWMSKLKICFYGFFSGLSTTVLFKLLLVINIWLVFFIVVVLLFFDIFLLTECW